MDPKLFIGTPKCEKKLSSKLFWHGLCGKCMVAMATPSMILKNRRRPTNSRVLLVLDHQNLCQIKA